MPRRSRQESSTGCYHLINRGVTRKPIFHKDEDCGRYLSLADEYAQALGTHIYHYCLMPNHTHWLVYSPEIRLLSQWAHFVQRRYAYHYCRAYHWAGSLFQGRYRCVPIESPAQLLECGRYIERNPLRAGLVKNIQEYRYHSAHFYGWDGEDKLITPSPEYEALSNQPSKRSACYREYLLQDRLYENEYAGDLDKKLF